MVFNVTLEVYSYGLRVRNIRFLKFSETKLKETVHPKVRTFCAYICTII